MEQMTLYKDLLKDLEAKGLFKRERQITTAQGACIDTVESKGLLNFCANNYLGLANDPRVIAAAKAALDTYGFGMASVRFICGTQRLHRQLEEVIADFLGKEDAMLYTSCFDANGGLFESLLGKEDAVFSDSLNHASIIDGIRLCKAQRYRYANDDMQALEACLSKTSARIRWIVTDGVFSMDGTYARLADLVSLARKYQAFLLVDDSHATGFVGASGRGSAQLSGVLDEVDLISSTLGKALGGGSGGFLAGNKTIVELLRQTARPYLFSNSLPPSLVGASLEVFRILKSSGHLRARLEANTRYFRSAMMDLGFDLIEGSHPIVPIMLYDPHLSSYFAENLLKEGIYVVSFSYPVVPRDQARVRIQLSAAHTREHLDLALSAFEKVGRALGVLRP